MYQFNSEANLIIHGCIAVIIIGVFYNLMITSKAYGGIVGKAIRLIGIATLFISINALEKVLVNFSIIEPTFASSIFQDVMILFGLIFLGLGFSKLASGAK
jgi:hypothetical protein